LIFGRSQRRGGVPPHARTETPRGPSHTEFYHITFDMMVKGNVVRRRDGEVRQYGVTVGGSTCLVTSGDTVDQETYEALLAAEAIRVPPPTGDALPEHDAASEADPTGG